MAVRNLESSLNSATGYVKFLGVRGQGSTSQLLELHLYSCKFGVWVLGMGSRKGGWEHVGRAFPEEMFSVWAHIFHVLTPKPLIGL